MARSADALPVEYCKAHGGPEPVFVQQPLPILIVALLHLELWTGVRFGRVGIARHADALGWPAVAWLLYAGWEWAVLIGSPGADLRVDLWLFWPLLGALSAWAVVRVFRA